MGTHAAIRSFFLSGPAGRLEALLNVGSPDATHAALVCHPHPLFGGTMHNKVVFQTMKALHGFGFPVLRFNFRGAGKSEGEHDQGRGEVDDVRTAIDWLDHEFHLPVIFAGFSFGASTGLRAACPDPRVVALISVGTPVHVDGRTYRYRYLAECAKPKLFISGSEDEFGPRAALDALFENAAEPKKLALVEGAGHFFHGKLGEVRRAIAESLPEMLAAGMHPARSS
jgi:alpha/beta superfamily hydrolase